MLSFRELKISLAAKCQLLFGVAVALIIGAALFAPWQRMEQLTEELDRRAARTLTDQALVQHIVESRMRPTWARVATTLPTSRPAAGGADGVTEDPEVTYGAGATTRGVRLGRESYFVPRLVAASREDLTTSERRALARFARRGDEDARSFYYTRRDGTSAFRYTRAAYARGDCLECHTAQAEMILELPQPGAALAQASANAAAAGTAADPAATVAPALKLPRGLIGTVTVDLPSQRETNQVLLNRVFFLAAGLLAGSLAIVVFSLITGRFILQPVRVLQETAEKVSEGDLDIRSHIGTGDEFQQLSETINTMLANLQHSEHQLRTANRSLDAKLTQLNETNLALAETNRLKSEFLANVSHELRTPLNSILGFAELLKKAAEQAQDARATRYAQNIHASGTNLLALINDLLDLAKVEAGRMEVRPAEFTLGELFESLTSVLKPLTEPKQVTISGEVDVGVPILVQDVSKVQQVLYNFLSNAIKFSPTGGMITLRAAMDDDDHVRLTVTDQGPGIEPEKQRLIFEKFRQLDGGVTRQYGGTGLGLAISKELTALLGGRIGIESNVGEGASFYVVLPVRIEAEMAEVRRT